MGKKLSFVSTMENIEHMEKNILFSVSSILRNVTHIADIFFAPPHHYTTSVRESENVSLSKAGDFSHRSSSGANISEIKSSFFATSPGHDGTRPEINETYHDGLASSTVFAQMQDFYIRFLYQCWDWALILATIWLLNRFLLKTKFLDFFPKFITSWLLTLLMLPALLSILPMILLCRLGTKIYLKAKFNNRVFLAHPMDASWAFETYASPSTCTGLYVIEGECKFERIVKTFENCMTICIDGKFMFERMRYCLRKYFGFVCWENSATFETKRHIKLISQVNPKLDKTGVNQVELFEELQRLHDEPFENSDLPPWEILVFPNYIPENQPLGDYYALVFRIHHSIMDGVSTGNALHTGIADKPFKFTVDPIEPLKVTRLQYLIAQLMALWMMPYITMKNLLLFERHRFHGETLTGKKNFRWTRAVRLEALKTMKNVTQTSVFSILMNCIGGALRGLFILKEESVPEVIHAAPPVAILPFPDRVLRNRFSIVIFPLNIGLEHVMMRLDKVYESAKNLARSSDILANYFTMNILGLLPLYMIKFLGSFAHATMTLSNIPGPAETVTMFGGDKLVDVGAWVPIKNTIGIGMALFSYADRLRVTIIADEACLGHEQDVEYLRDEFENQLTEMAKLLEITQPLFSD